MQSITNNQKHSSVPVQGKNGMVASSQPLATEIGLNILKAGGNAIDAAIATNAALGLMEPHMCGIGGDLFVIGWDANSGSLYGLNASGPSPEGLSYEELLKVLEERELTNFPIHDALSVSVPGTVDGWFKLYESKGCLPMEEILAPAIHYAENGFPLTPIIAKQWAQWVENLEELASGDFKKIYQPGGRCPSKGEVFKNPALASSYAAIARNGRGAFYQGEIGQRLVDFICKEGGYLQSCDLADYDSQWIDPVSVNYRGYEIYELPPNGQGLAALQILKLLENDDLRSLGHLNPDCLHLMLEAKKLAFEDRARFYADPEHAENHVSELLSDSYNKSRRENIGDQAASVVHAGDPRLQHSDTVYLTTADSKGNMVSFIQSIFHPFGSGVVVPDTGFALQNRGMSFSLDTEHANVYAPAKRPFHTIIPAFILKDGQPFMSFGVMGADMQPQGHVQIITNIIDFDMNLQEAGDTLRWRHEQSTQPVENTKQYLKDGGVVILEPGFDQGIRKELEKRGHKVEMDDNDFLFGGYQAIMRDEDGSYLGASERRKDGCAMGY